MESQEKNTRIYYYDLIKLIAAFMVVFYHFSYYKLDYGDIGNGWYVPNLNRVIMNVCSSSIPLFFMVNGALLFRKRYELKQICFKIIKIIFLILVWRIVKFPEWFFRTLVILYLLYPMLYYMYEQKKKYIFIVMSFLLLFPFLYNYIVLVLSAMGCKVVVGGKMIIFSEFPRTGFFTMYSIVYFLGGKILSECTLNKKISCFLGVLGLGLSILESILGVKAYGNILDGVNGSFPTIGALCMTIAIFEFAKMFKFNSIENLQKCSSLIV